MKPGAVSGTQALSGVQGAPKFPHTMYVSAAFGEDADLLLQNGRVKAYICTQRTDQAASGEVETIFFTPKNYRELLYDIEL